MCLHSLDMFYPAGDALFQLVSGGQVQQTPVFAFLDVVPGEPLLQPRCLQAGQMEVRILRVMADRETIRATAAGDRRDLDYAVGDFTLAANPPRRAVAAPRPYQRGSLRWRACPR